MKHTISIKHIGKHIGTVGWLAKQIDSGAITVDEGLNKAGKLALWLHRQNDTGEFDNKGAGYKPTEIVDYDNYGVPGRSQPGRSEKADQIKTGKKNMTQLEAIQNINGGGLSFDVTGQYTSVRHAMAKEDGKLTAGEAAKILSKKVGEKISAKNIVAAFKLLTGREPEWHHSGFYKPQGGGRKTMGRTFFFTNEQVEEMAARWNEVAVKKAEKDAKEELARVTQVCGFYYEWDHDYTGRYGKKVNYKVLHTYEGSEANAPRNFQKCETEILEMAKKQDGRKYYGWEEPTESNIRERAGA